MGTICSLDCFKNDLAIKDFKFLLLGLKGAGKTSILMKFSGETDAIIQPTVGYNTLTLEFDPYAYHFWDLGGGKGRNLWPCYYIGTDGIIFVVDVQSSSSSFHKETAELKRILEHESLHDCYHILVFLNKHDLTNKRFGMKKSPVADMEKFCEALLEIGEVLEQSELKTIDANEVVFASHRKEYVLQSEDKQAVKNFCIQTSSAANGTGLNSGLNWLTTSCISWNDKVATEGKFLAPH